jgi:hypothetical protein
MSKAKTRQSLVNKSKQEIIESDIIEETSRLGSLYRQNRQKLGETLREIDATKLWWKMGYSSLFRYCEQELKLTLDEVDGLLAED